MSLCANTARPYRTGSRRCVARIDGHRALVTQQDVPITAGVGLNRLRIQQEPDRRKRDAITGVTPIGEHRRRVRRHRNYLPVLRPITLTCARRVANAISSRDRSTPTMPLEVAAAAPARSRRRAAMTRRGAVAARDAGRRSHAAGANTEHARGTMDLCVRSAVRTSTYRTAAHRSRRRRPAAVVETTAGRRGMRAVRTSLRARPCRSVDPG